MTEPRETAPSQSTALALTDERRGFMRLSSLREARELAETLASADMIPKHFHRNPGNVLVALQMGAELGLSPMQAIQNIAVVGGRPSLYGDGMLAVCLAHPDCLDVREVYDPAQQVAVCTVTRRGREPVVRSFSREEAHRAGLAPDAAGKGGKDGPWRLYTERMLAMRARAFALRDAFADALRGISMVEEQRDVEEHRRVERAQAAGSNAGRVEQRVDAPTSPRGAVVDATTGEVAAPAQSTAPEDDPIIGGIMRRIADAATGDELGRIAAEIASSVGPHLADGDRAAMREAYRRRAREISAMTGGSDGVAS